MKLSEAIRIGSMQTGETHESFINSDGDTCAIGAALVAVGYTKNQIDVLSPIALACKEFRISEDKAMQISSKHSLGHSRTFIADWLDKEEELSKPVDEPVEEPVEMTA